LMVMLHGVGLLWRELEDLIPTERHWLQVRTNRPISSICWTLFCINRLDLIERLGELHYTGLLHGDIRESKSSITKAHPDD
jgi:hypothetical protein